MKYKKTLTRIVSLISLAYLLMMTFALFGTPIVFLVLRPLPSLIGNLAVVGVLLFCIEKILTIDSDCKTSLKDLIKTYKIYLLWLVTGVDKIPKSLKCT